MGAFFGLLAFGLSIGVVVGIGKWILDPVEAAARRFQRPTQFTIADFLSLMFLLQLPMGVVHSLLRDAPKDTKFLLDAAGWIICSLMWGLSVKKLSCAGIERPRHRLIFLALVLPITYFGTFAFAILGLAALAVAEHGDASWAIALLLIDVALLAAFRFAAGFVRRMVAASEPEPQPVHVEVLDRRGVERQ